MDRFPNAHKRELCRVKKRVDERIDEGFLGGSTMWRGWRMIGFFKRVYVGESACSSSLGRPWKRWIDTLKDCLRKRGLNIRIGVNGGG